MPESERRVVAVLTRAETDALILLGAALEPHMRAKSPVNTGTAKLDEQAAAQSRDPYEEAKDELRDRLGAVLSDQQDSELDYDALARAVVGRVLGIYA